MWLVKRGRRCTARAAEAERIQSGTGVGVGGMWKEKYSPLNFDFRFNPTGKRYPNATPH